MGYFHHVNFADVHTPREPAGPEAAGLGEARPAPPGPLPGIVILCTDPDPGLPGLAGAVGAPPVGAWRSCRSWSCASVLLVNLSYPEWTGGWSTGPRLLLPLIPFAMIPVAGLLAGTGPWTRAMTVIAAGLAVAGGIEMFLFQGADGRIPHELQDPATRRIVPLSEPLRDEVWPIWTGSKPSTGWRFRQRFSPNLVSWAAPRFVRELGPALGAAPVPAAGRRADRGDPRALALW